MMTYDKETVEYVEAECDAEGCDKHLSATKLREAYNKGWLFYTASRGERKVNKAFCSEHRALIVSSIDQFFDEADNL